MKLSIHYISLASFQTKHPEDKLFVQAPATQVTMPASEEEETAAQKLQDKKLVDADANELDAILLKRLDVWGKARFCELLRDSLSC